MKILTNLVLEKLSDVTTQLLPHQQRVVDRIQRKDQPGLVVAHGLGSGKTLTSIAAQDALGMPATVVVPAALKANYEKERSKHLSGPRKKVDLSTIQMAGRRGSIPHNPLMVVDEAHRLRETSGKGSKAIASNTAKKRLLLTGSPFYNRPGDLSGLVNIAAGSHVLPSDQATFEQRYIHDRLVSPGFINKLRGVQAGTVQELNRSKANELKDIYGKWVDYHAGSAEGFPTVTREDVKVPMTRRQLGVYDALAGTAPSSIQKKVRAGLPPSKAEAGQLNAFINAVRQVSNSTAPFSADSAEEPKIDLAFSRLQDALKKNDKAKAVVYSNYLAAGIKPYRDRLEAAKIPFGEFTGEMNKSQRDQLVRDYNENKIKALLLSSAGGEGLDLKGTRLIQMLEPHWNAEKLKQVEGRGIRYQSHDALPEQDRNVHVERYLAQRPTSGFLERLHLKKPGMSADEYLADRSADKERLNKQFQELLPTHGVKTAGRKLSLPELGEVANRLHGSPGILYETRKAVSSGNVKALKELTRGNLLNSAVEVPFSNRLKVYKEWKATGNVPRVDRRGNIVHQPDLFHYEHSTDPVTVVHGGGSNSIERMISSGARGGEQHGPYLIPGQTHAQRYSTYTFEVPKDEQGAALARRHASGYALGGEGPKTDAYQGGPATVEVTLPKKHVLFSKDRYGSREVIVPNYGSLGSLSYGQPTIQPAAPQKTAASVDDLQRVYRPSYSKTAAMKTVDFQGMKIRLDRPKGFVQTGKSKTGKPWARTYLFDYGFIPKTKGGDGDGVDVFIGPDKNDQESYWAIQKKDDGSFDEYKVFLGFGSKAAAKKAYTDHIPAKYLKGMVTIRTNMMKAMLGLEPVEKLASIVASLGAMEMAKEAVAERLARLAATPVEQLAPSVFKSPTPQLFMRSRSPQQLRELQNMLEAKWSQHVTNPIMQRAEPMLHKLPAGKWQTIARKGTELFAEDPVGTVAANLVPVPGAHPAYVLGKKGLEKTIDRFFPLPGVEK